VRERLLGFDARVVDEKALIVSTPSQKEIYLLRPDVDLILSTDVLLWPSVFQRDTFLAMNPPAGDNVLFLWCDLQRLLHHRERSGSEDARPFAVIGITRIDEPDAQVEWVPQCDPVPAKAAAGWKLLGFDVSDAALLSGLSNCGYDGAEISAFRKRWAPHLNRNHLFTEIEIAWEFRAVTDRRVKEHAPFFVYGLYRIESQGIPRGWPEISHRQ